ncbi:MAG: dihydrofolate reductase family protein, partial [Candidatus Moduliflexus flocculans]|nr:dihydrofolate reductase family protein [Candidatus Moduliflexus flocculans]
MPAKPYIHPPHLGHARRFFHRLHARHGAPLPVGERLPGDASLIGSATVVAGQSMFGGDVPAEEGFRSPKARPRGSLVDRGRFRREARGAAPTPAAASYCRDVIVLVSESTPVLSEASGSQALPIDTRRRAESDLRLALARLADDFGIGRIVTDTGARLSGVLLNEGFVDEVGLIVHPARCFEEVVGVFVLTLAIRN